MKNDYISKWFLFITSYLPLYMWLLLSNINYVELLKLNKKDLEISTKKLFYFVLVVFIIISIVELIQLFKSSGSEIKKIPKEMEATPESDGLMNYIVTYITPLVSFDLSDIKSVIMNIALFLLIGLMYVGSSATYLNPVLGIFGFKIFEVSGFPQVHHIISKFSYDYLETIKNRGDEVISYHLGDGICIIKSKK